MDTRYTNPGKILRMMFPEQTKSIPAIIVWTLVFLADLALVFLLCAMIGFDRIASEYFVAILVGGGFLLFWLETIIYNRIRALFR